MPDPVPFGKYLLTRELARGGMATVHLAILTGVEGFEKELVVKLIRRDLASDERFVEMFVSEAKNSVSLQHGNIVPVYELGVVDGVYFIAMERVHGRTLSDLLDTGVLLPPEAAVHVAIEVLRALAHAHSREPPLVHRDLSSRNVMITYEGEVKVLDFGIAGRAGAHGTRAWLGSFGYLAPEQLEGLPADPRSDLFAVGVQLHEMLTGVPLLPRIDDEEGREIVLRGKSAAPSKVRAESPVELDALVLRALERTPSERPSSAEEMAAPLRRWLAARGGFDPAVLGGILRERLPPGTPESTDPISDRGTARIPDPVAAARQVTIATSAVLAEAEGSARSRARVRTTQTTKAARRSRIVGFALPAALVIALVAWVLSPSGDPPTPPEPRTAVPSTAEPRTTEPERADPVPRTAMPVTTRPPVMAPQTGRLYLVVLPSGSVSVDGRSYGEGFPRDGVAFAAGKTVRIEVTGPDDARAYQPLRIKARAVHKCSVDFRSGLTAVRCREE